ncbi:DUF2844 domain-containing protein [Burkholderia oklahomensis]|uniref:DUF2844 domain-containing protein n=1 Tax=Burkholderia oklahomensis TaxID=342113 RepID=UPI0005DA4600|nr:DUF2844 domain-containing protein [Burkholderia oklahomensis]AJX31187.1 hypothetical protein BG90_3590 [Burkholderia oklahomensis C6786]AOI46175.1 hypothetical protein WI23_10490 [Burkholderia oklahomensis C6786]KUY64145.1 hypothetical protein WI23_06765 [Burkholderia oklahomensis C6786]MBI0361252.1 DUF2844 domain-containing protein [Burkholderia oklahomensis]SUW55040.1 Protein of uncharacterised function (DUF2844) [Burkholderia oklahomensis]
MNNKKSFPPTRRRLARVLLVAAAVALAPAAAQSQLGSTAPNSSARTFAQTSPPLFSGAVTMRSHVDAGGTTIREYATRTGLVFAYTWDGPTSPNLRQLLGERFATYQSHAVSTDARARTGLHAGRVAQSDFVVEAGGRMRAYVGRAWLPGAVPSGVSIDDLQ